MKSEYRYQTSNSQINSMAQCTQIHINKYQYDM